ncbi:MAG: Dabb family protein [Solobacterium sp.]|jgi:uncharacterized lipoprotein YehR (DUF1307 family)|nr:Dabb family protein [Solobacterium sp.]MBR3345016.1 Dabb family protein [Solobacterium sp.]HAE15664.1 stress responsive protein [Erysipelotrichaceae bacterium]
MVKHIILWKLKDSLSAEEKETAKKEIKEGLEGLKGRIEGLTDIHVYTDGLASSNTDIMLESVHTDRDALAFYAGHPLHVDVKDNIIVPKVSGRYAFDFDC